MISVELGRVTVSGRSREQMRDKATVIEENRLHESDGLS
jgi:hypothetical protein